MLKQGFHIISKAEYLADPCPEPSLSSSIAHLLVSESPMHAWSAHPRGGAHRTDPTAAMVRGSLIDTLLLGGDEEVMVLPEKLPNAKGDLVPTNDAYQLNSAKEWRDECLSAGRLPVKAGEMRAARATVEAIREKLDAKGVKLDGQHQLTAIWQEGDVWCRGRLDHWISSSGIIYDLKTCESANPRAIASKMINFGYDIQAAAYVRAVEAICPDLTGRVRMEFIFCETEPPYDVVITPLAGSMRALGASRWERAVALWAEGLRTKRWPGYVAPAAGIEAPAWALAEMTEGLQGGSKEVSF